MDIYNFHILFVLFSALKKKRMERGGRNREPFSLTMLSFLVTQLWMLWDGYVFITFTSMLSVTFWMPSVYCNLSFI